MDATESSRYRRGVVMLTYLALDRPDIASTADALARRMARPRCGDEVGLKRCLRYLRAHPTVIIEYPIQDDTHELYLMTDADWATCKETRKSRSGGVLVRGRHAVAWWSKSHATVALSSGEAEYNACAAGLAEQVAFLCLRQETCADENWGREGLSMGTDSVAAKGILNRVGSGAVKHMSVNQMWGQQLVRQHQVRFTILQETITSHMCSRARPP